MKKIIVVILAVCLLAITACQKSNSGVSGGSWTFKSNTYNSNFTNWVLGAFTSYTVKNYPTGSLALTFYDSISNTTIDSIEVRYHRAHVGTNAPDTNVLRPEYSVPKNTTYRISHVNPPDSGFVYLFFSDSSATRYYTSLPSATAIVTVTKAADGKLTVNIPGVEMLSTKNSSDSALLIGNITQTP